MDAHCNNPKHFAKGNPCRVNKSICPGVYGSALGRPAALLLAWLAHSNHFSDADTATNRANHGKCIFKCNRSALDKVALGDSKRAELRAWLLDRPAMEKVLKHERKQRGDEPSEPPGL
jgi:hypothetical protein